MLTCKCGEGKIEFTIAKDIKTRVVLVQAICTNCGKMANGWGFSVEEAMKGVEEKWKKNTRHQRHQSILQQKMV